MNERNAFINGSVAMNGESHGTLVACGLWLRLGFVGGSAAFAGIAEFLGGHGTSLSALALAAGGAALAVFAWRRAYMAIDGTKPADTGIVNMSPGEISTAGGA